MGTTTSYALIQDSVGSTFLNAANAKTISFRINNANVIAMDATALYSYANGVENLGKSGNRWNNVYSEAGNFSGTVTGGTFSGSGASLTSLSAQLSSGTVPGARLGNVYTTSSSSDVLSVSNGAISAVDGNTDKLVFWDESAGKLKYLTFSDLDSFTIMGLQSSDLILVERSNTIYKETYGNRANIDSSDLLLVERSNTLYKCTYADWANANSSDLILVERSNTLYKETKSNWPTSSNIDIHSANHMITLGTLLYDEGEDSTNPYSVVEVQMEVSSSASYADGDLFIGFRNTAPTAWQGDFPIAAVQILQSDGSTVRVTDWHDCTWNFALGNTQAGYADWATTRYEDTLESNPENASGGYYGCPSNCIDDSKTKWRFSFTDDGTTSSYVGAAKGIPSVSYGGGPAYTGNPSTTSILPVGTANVAKQVHLIHLIVPMVTFLQNVAVLVLMMWFGYL